MATRLWFLDSQLSLTSAPQDYDAGWNYTTEGSKEWNLSTVKAGTIATGTQIGAWSGTAGQKAIDRQYRCPMPLRGGQVLDGTIKGQIMVREYNNADNVDQIIINLRICRADGSGTDSVLSLGSYGPTAEFINNNSHRNKTIADGDSLSGATTQDGDWLVLEIGYSNSTAATTPEASARYGGTDADLPEDETQTTDGASWVEFSQDLWLETSPINPSGDQGVPQQQRLTMGVGR